MKEELVMSNLDIITAEVIRNGRRCRGPGNGYHPGTHRLQSFAV